MKIAMLASIWGISAGTALSATISISGGTAPGSPFETTVSGSDGSTPLPLNSLVEVGYFPNLTAAPTTQAQWDTFTPVSGLNWFIGLNRDDDPDPANPGQFQGSSRSLDTELGHIPNERLQMGMRFYDGTTIGGSLNYNTAARDEWNVVPQEFLGSTDRLIALNVATPPAVPNLVWEDNANPLSTSISLVPVPEPSSALLTGLAALTLVRRKR